MVLGVGEVTRGDGALAQVKVKVKVEDVAIPAHVCHAGRMVDLIRGATVD